MNPLNGKQMKQYSCYSFYDNSGRRVAAFGKEIGGKLRVFLIYTSKKDKFNKGIARMVYYWYDMYAIKEPWHPEIITIDIPEHSTSKYTFMQYLESRFFKKRTYKMVIPGQKVTISRVYNKGLPLSELLYVETEEFYKTNQNGHRAAETGNQAYNADIQTDNRM